MGQKAQQTDISQFGYQQELKRAFGVWQLTAYGLNYMIPIAPAIVFGFVLKASGGTVALPYLFALCGMLFTAMGYAYFVKRYPLAGSVYNYVSKASNVKLGFLSGWAILLDYMLVPTVTAMSASVYIHNLMPWMPYEVILVTFIIFTGLLNLIGANPLAKLGLSMLIFGELVIFIAFFVWAYAVHVHHLGVGHLVSAAPFHFSSFNALTAATSIAMLSYLGFDAITTLAEEAKQPKKDIPKAIFLSLIIGSLTMFLTGYLGTLLVPDWHRFIHDTNWLNTALFFVSQRAGGYGLEVFYTFGFVVAMAVFNVVATTGASRIVFSISRDGVLPIKCLSKISKRTRVPTYSILLIVGLQVIIGSLCSIDMITMVVNFGALLGFVALNTAFLVHQVRYDDLTGLKKAYLIVPIIGFALNLWILSHLAISALLSGVAWLCLGVVLLVINKPLLQ